MANDCKSESTLVLIKPDAVKRKLVGEIISRFERRGFRIRGLVMYSDVTSIIEKHYAEHYGKPYYKSLVDFMASGRLVAIDVNGPNAVSVVRTMIGTTDPAKSAPGTIRGDYALVMSSNVIHASDSLESAQRELALWFN
ncbi:nucleoside diphosphate kinase [Carp edema virus]|nr:nucleoside diphosphate kinase [Carp edema virus]